jgi:hypothetical protein
LRGTNSGYGGFVEHFYPVLADRHVLDEHLLPNKVLRSRSSCANRFSMKYTISAGLHLTAG